MDFSLATYGLGAAAGLLSTLSPCVLPLLPILIGSAVAAHPRAPWALAAGLALSYGVVGTVLASAGSLLGLSPGLLRGVSAGLLAVLGAVLLVEPLQQRFAAGLAGVGNAGQQWLQRLSLTGLRGQFVVGLLLGLVWSPCVGPTLGAAVVLAAQGQQLAQVAALMGLFGVGAALPVVLLATVSRAAIGPARGRLLQLGKQGKRLMGAALLLVALLILSGLDKHIETWLTALSPAWLNQLSTRY
jgi:cytochrome c biogenesis protein CcdA